MLGGEGELHALPVCITDCWDVGSAASAVRVTEVGMGGAWWQAARMNISDEHSCQEISQAIWLLGILSYTFIEYIAKPFCSISNVWISEAGACTVNWPVAHVRPTFS